MSQDNNKNATFADLSDAHKEEFLLLTSCASLSIDILAQIAKEQVLPDWLKGLSSLDLTHAIRVRCIETSGGKDEATTIASAWDKMLKESGRKKNAEHN